MSASQSNASIENTLVVVFLRYSLLPFNVTRITYQGRSISPYSGDTLIRETNWMKKLLLIVLSTVLLLFQTPVNAVLDCGNGSTSNSALNIGVVVPAMWHNQGTSYKIFEGQPFLLQWYDPDKILGETVSIVRHKIINPTSSNPTVDNSSSEWLSNVPNTGWIVLTESMVQPQSNQETATYTYKVTNSAVDKNIYTPCFSFTDNFDHFGCAYQEQTGKCEWRYMVDQFIYVGYNRKGSHDGTIHTHYEGWGPSALLPGPIGDQTNLNKDWCDIGGEKWCLQKICHIIWRPSTWRVAPEYELAQDLRSVCN